MWLSFSPNFPVTASLFSNHKYFCFVFYNIWIIQNNSTVAKHWIIDLTKYFDAHFPQNQISKYESEVLSVSAIAIPLDWCCLSNMVIVISILINCVTVYVAFLINRSVYFYSITCSQKWILTKDPELIDFNCKMKNHQNTTQTYRKITLHQWMWVSKKTRAKVFNQSIYKYKIRFVFLFFVHHIHFYIVDCL